MKKLIFFVFIYFVIAQNIGYFWQISDPHIDVDYKSGADPDNCNFEIMCCRHFFSNQTRRAGQFGETNTKFICDTPERTIDVGFKFINEYSQRLNPKPDFIFLTGDFAAHDNEFQSEELNLEKLQMISQYAQKAAGCCSNMKVYSTVGNHDVYPVDQLKPPPNTFNDKLARIWSMHNYPSDVLEDIRKGGYYSLTITKGLRLIDMNTQWMNEINFWNASIDHANQMSWLEQQFIKAEQSNEKILIVGHIAPHFGSRWPEWKLNKFYSLIKKYHARVIGQLYGHSHSDSFKLILDQNENVLSQVLVGGVMTTGNGRNSAMRLYKYDKETFKLLDYEDFIADIKESNNIGRIEYKKGYQFTKEYQVEDASPQSFYKLWKKFKESDEFFSKYQYNYQSRFERRECTGDCKTQMLNSMINKI